MAVVPVAKPTFQLELHLNKINKQSLATSLYDWFGWPKLSGHLSVARQGYRRMNVFAIRRDCSDWVFLFLLFKFIILIYTNLEVPNRGWAWRGGSCTPKWICLLSVAIAAIEFSWFSLFILIILPTYAQFKEPIGERNSAVLCMSPALIHSIEDNISVCQVGKSWDERESNYE